MTIKTMDCYWCRRLGSILYQRASIRLFIPRHDDVFPLCIKWWSSLGFLTGSRFLRMSSSGIKMTSLIECPAWLKCKETGVGSLSWRWFKMDRRCSPDRSLSWRLVSPMYWHLNLLHWIKGPLLVSGQRIVKYSIKIVSIKWPLDYVFGTPIETVKSRLVPAVSLSRYMSCPLKSSGIPEN